MRCDFKRFALENLWMGFGKNNSADKTEDGQQDKSKMKDFNHIISMGFEALAPLNNDNATALTKICSIQLSQQHVYHAFSLPQVATTEQIQVVQDMVKIVKLFSDCITLVQRPTVTIGGIKILAKTTK